MAALSGERVADPGAVRVSLAPASAEADASPMVVAPSPADRDGTDGPETAEATGILVDGRLTAARLTLVDPDRATLVTEAGRARVLLGAVEPGPSGRGAVRLEVVVDGWRVELDVESEALAALRDRARRGRDDTSHGGPTEVHAIIPGRVVSVSVVPGDAVVAGQQLLVVEAMKMQNELRAPREGIITRVEVGAGETIEIGDLLLVLE